ncbi:MAG: TerC family protein [Thermoleophilia bacterium]|nr:TerC family protein [Thermoleophilia bacterium]
MNVPLWAWAALIAVVVVFVLIDLLGQRDPRAWTLRRAGAWSAVWFALGLGFTVVVAIGWDGELATQYVSGYLLEKSLSVDNIFVFALIFAYFAVPDEFQPRVLLWGVIGALVFRAIFIALGAALLGAAGWVLYIFGAFLLYTGIKLWTHDSTEVHPEKNPVLRLVRSRVPMTDDYRGNRVFIREAGRRVATPMLAVLLMIATTDLIFALDSIPAIFAVTDEAFLVFAANAFAVMGLRALYFLLAGAMQRFYLLHYGLSAVLVIIGTKMLLGWLWHPPVWLTLSLIVTIIGGAIALSLYRTRGQPGGRPLPVQ